MRDMIIAFVVTLALAALVVGLWVGFYYHPIITTAVAVPLVILWTIFSIRIVGPDEMAVMVLFGYPVAVVDSGICFVPWFFGLTYIVRYSKKTYNLEYKGIEVITMADEYPKNSGNFYGATKIKVDAAEYLNFPRPDTELGPDDDTHPLIKILRAGVPRDKAGLQGWTKESVDGAVRLAFGQITWKQAAQEMGVINEEVVKIFKDGNSTLVKTGFRDPGIKLVVSKIVLPAKVEEALTRPEETRLEAEAASKDAEAQAIDRLETVLYAIARSTGEDINDVKIRVKGDDALQRRLLKYAMKLHADIEKADRKAYFKLDSSGNPFLDAIALYRQLAGGGGQQTPPTTPGSAGGQGGNPSAGQYGENYTEEELEKALKDKEGK